MALSKDDPKQFLVTTAMGEITSLCVPTLHIMLGQPSQVLAAVGDTYEAWSFISFPPELITAKVVAIMPNESNLNMATPIIQLNSMTLHSPLETKAIKEHQQEMPLEPIQQQQTMQQHLKGKILPIFQLQQPDSSSP